MKKLTFKVSNQKVEFVALVKEINDISCRIRLDLEHGVITVEDVDDTMIDRIIDLIDNSYTILNVDIDNIIADTNKNSIVSTKVENAPNIIGYQSEENLIIKEVKFENAYIEELANKFLKTAYWAMFKKNISEKEIGNFIYSSMSEISMQYNNKDCIKVYAGDIVDCNYGTHITGEVNGNHVLAIVCNISSTGMTYLVPLTKKSENLTSNSYLQCTVPTDITFDYEDYVGGTVLLDKGKYVRSERINSVIGKANPEFLKKILNQLAKTFDFTESYVEGKSISGIVIPNENEDVIDTEQRGTEVDIMENRAEKPDKPFKTEVNNKKVGKGETVLLEVIGYAFDELDTTKPLEEQVDEFLNSIEMSNEGMVKQAFIVACNMKKISYGTIASKLHESDQSIEFDMIEANLRENFDNWLKMHSEVKEKCPRISIMSLIKLFAKEIA